MATNTPVRSAVVPTSLKTSQPHQLDLSFQTTPPLAAVIPPAAEFNTPSLADVLAALPQASALTSKQRQDMASAVRKVIRLLGEEAAHIPANRRALTRRLASIAPAACGISERNWSNIRTRLNASLDLVLPNVPPGQRNLPLEAEWRGLKAALPTLWERRALSRFFSFCGRAALAPQDVDEATMERFKTYLEDTRLKTTTILLREARTAWNNACDEVPNWPGKPLPVAPRPNEFSLPWEAFPESLRQDLQGWLDRIARKNASSWRTNLTEKVVQHRPSRAVRPTTLKHREYQVRLFASALVRAGVDPSSLRSLADLVKLETMDLGLQYYRGRHQDKVIPALPGMIGGLQAIARHWVGMDPNDLALIKQCLQDMRSELPRRSMTRKNTARLRSFDDKENALRLLRLPATLFDLARKTLHPHRAALLMQHALAIELLLMAPMRIGNLTKLDIVKHIHLVNRARGTQHIVIPANEVKNDRDLEYPLPVPCAALLKRYLDTVRPALAGAGSTALFPGQGGAPKNSQAFGRQLSKVVFEHTGFHMNPHLFRHTVAKLYLRLHPKDMETVRLALGHRSIVTTRTFYTEANNVMAIQRFDAVILELRGGTSW